MDILILLTVFQLMSLHEAFNVSCPSQAHWKLLSKSKCIPARYYTCLYDVTRQVNAYRHRCSRPRSLKAGYKYVFQPNLNKAACSITRYQPLFFDTVGNSDCIFLKSVCNSEGQKTDGKGNTTSDRTCICNIYNGYTFVEDKGNRSTCNPSVDDCSCYIGIHPNNRTICSKDLKCTVEDLISERSQGDTFNKSESLRIIEFDNYKYNLVSATNGYRSTAAVSVFVLDIILVIGGTYILQGILRKQSKTLSTCTAPRQFDIVRCSYCSITFRWYKQDSGENLEYEIAYRVRDTRDWIFFTISKPEIVTKDKKCCMFTLRNLLPETYYELKMCSLYNHGKSQYTSYQIQQTTKYVLPEAMNRLPEGERMKYKNMFQSSTTEERFLVRIMIVGKHNVGKTCLLRRLLKESITDVVSTDGVDIVLRRCKINIEDGKWIIGKDFDDDLRDRLQRALNKSQRKKTVNAESGHKKTDIVNSKIIEGIGKTLSDNKSQDKDNDKDDLLLKTKNIESSKHNHVTPIIKSYEQQDNKARNHNGTDDVDRTDGSFKSQHNSIKVDKINEEDRNIGYPERLHKALADNQDTVKSETNSYIKDNDSKSSVKNIKTVPDIRASLEENDDMGKSSNVVIPEDLMSHVFSETTLNTNISTNPYAFCELWDFAGQKEFYATHQAFLTSSAIYLVVADMADDIDKQGINQYFADFGNVGEYVDFWFDSIYCHRTIDLPLNKTIDDLVEPCILLVFTGKDNYNEKQFEKRKKELSHQLKQVFGKQRKYRHLKKTFYFSNTTDQDDKYEILRDEISATAKQMKNWGELLPLNWIVLEHLIGINKNAGINFLSLASMMTLARHPDINIQDINGLLLFLHFQHEVGNIIFYDNIPDLIILNPKWLLDALRCLVTDRYDETLQNCSDWLQFDRTGKIKESLVTQLFQSKRGSQYSGQKTNLFKVMEKLDILVKVQDTCFYIMPSMMRSLKFEDICQNFGILEANCKRTSWLCLKFSFLPPSFYSHFSAWFIRNFNPSIESGNESLALYRGICIFDIDRSGCEKILVTMSTDTIALQILSFTETKKEFGSMCSIIRKELLKNIEEITERYKLKINIEERFKCSDGDYHQDTWLYQNLTSAPEQYCIQHKTAHDTTLLYLPWMSDVDEVPTDAINYLKIVALLHIAEDAVRIVFDGEFNPSVLHKWLKRNYGRLKRLYLLKHLLLYQWDVLCSCIFDTEKKDLSKRFDLQLMLCLLKNFTKLKICNQPRSYPGDISTDISEVLSTIWYHRAKVVNNVNGTTPHEHFQQDWMTISQAIQRLSEGSNQMLEFKCLTLEKCRLDDKKEMSAEESNYLRIVHLVTSKATNVVRKCFDDIYPPGSGSLHGALHEKQGFMKIHEKRKWIGSQQFAVLYPIEGKVSSDMLDIKTMAILMKYLKDIKLEHNFSKIDSNPNYCADLSRLWWYRREIISTRKFTMDEFNRRWLDISGAVIRLGGKSYIDVCSQLKMVPL